MLDQRSTMSTMNVKDKTEKECVASQVVRICHVWYGSVWCIVELLSLLIKVYLALSCHGYKKCKVEYIYMKHIVPPPLHLHEISQCHGRKLYA